MAREYKDSGIEWIGQIPKEWKVIKLKHESQFINGYAFDSNDFKLEGDVRVVRIGDIGLSIDWNNCIYVNNSAILLDAYKICNGDILIAMSGATTGKCCLATNIKEAYINQRVGIIRSEKRKLVFFSLLAPYFKEYVNLNNAGSAQPNISSKAIGEFPLVMPKSLSEQQKIVDYLDKVCGEVDEMVALQETMIEELKAYKQSIITEAVTKGLNPNVPMKNSGIDWIGEIPEHWDKDKIIRIFNLIGSGTTPSSSDNEAYEGKLNWIQSGDINGGDLYESKNKISEKTLKKYSALTMYDAPFIIIAMYGASVGNISISHINGCVNQACCVMSETKQDFKYVFYAIKSAKDYLIYKAVGGGQPNISQSTLKQLWLPVPPLSEQQSIVSYLDTKCSEIDSLTAIKQQKIAELKEYKKSVIYEYVTGKKEVV